MPIQIPTRRYTTTALLFVSLNLVCPRLVHAQDAVLGVTTTQPYIEGNKTAPVTAQPVQVSQGGKTHNGVQFTFSSRKAYNYVSFSTNVSVEELHTLRFRAKFEGLPEGKRPIMSVAVGDASGTRDSTAFVKVAKLEEDGWYQFSWDALNQPDIVGGANLSAIKNVVLQYNFSSIPAGQTVTMTLVDMHFTSGFRARAGNPELFDEWRNYIRNYSPDYSDSSKYLEPPLEGRVATPIPLVQGGKTSASIIVPPQATGPLDLAGKELAKWLGAVTGAQFPIQENGTAGNGPRILLGAELASAKFGADIAWLQGTDGFAVRASGNDIHIFGATPKGTLNGVFAFLENNTDIIWPRPRLEMEAVYSVNPNLKIVWANGRDKPSSRLRGWSTNLGRRSEHEIWSVRNRLNYPKGGGGAKSDGNLRAAAGDYVEFGGGHNISGYLGKENPERFYPTIDGKVPAKFNIWKHQPNFTAPGIADVVAENALKYIAEKAPAGINCLNINIEDNWGVSTDPKSLEPIRLPDGTLLPSTDGSFRSTQYFLFLNEVARKIKAVHPKMMVGTYAYFFTSTPPKIRLEDNIRVYYCPYIRKDQRTPLSAPVNNHWWWRLEAWAKATPNLVMREYYGIGNGYRPLAETVAFDVRSYMARGVQEYTAELNPDEAPLWHDGHIRGAADEWDFMAMDFWVINRLYWNPNQDVEQLRKYYLRRTYREAAPAMEKFFGTLRVEWFKKRRSSSFESMKSTMGMLVTGPKKEQELTGYLDTASKSVKHPVSKLQLDLVRMRLNSWVNRPKPGEIQAPPYPAALRALQHGWSSNNDWGGNAIWATASHWDIDGRLKKVVRVNVAPGNFGKADPGIVVSPLEGVPAGAEISFMAGLTTGKELPSFKLTARDKQNGISVAPESAFEKQPDGSVKVRWKLESDPNAKRKIDPSNAGRINLTLNRDSVTSKDTFHYYLWDFQITPPAGQ